ncbi:MAG TPA: DUF2232 domain-containing protein [Longimicrobiales bacterium]
MSERRGAREWVALVGLVLIAATFSVLSPGVLLAVPFALIALAFPPRRPLTVVMAVGLLALILSAHGGDGLWYFERGWALLLGAWFVAFVMLLPRAGFVNRAVAAVAASAATAAAFLALRRDGFAQLDHAVTERLRTVAGDAALAMSNVLRNSAGSSDMPSNMMKAAEMQAHLFPAMIGLASLASLGAGWWVFRRVTVSDEQPLRPLREFRFSDHLVWVLLIGAALLLLPVDELARRAGSNLVTFMAALYALRGIAVLVVIGGSPGPLGVVIGAVLCVVLYPLVVTATILVGLTDTWLDIRSKRPILPTPGS